MERCYGKVSMGAVKSILADVYLTYAGAAINGGAAAYAESAKRSLDVITNGGYTLFPNYTDMINPANKNLASLFSRYNMPQRYRLQTRLPRLLFQTSLRSLNILTSTVRFIQQRSF
jgi:hypothetical protein